MANELQTSIRAYTADDIQIKRFLRVDEARQLFQLEEEILLIVALSADALYRLPRTALIHQKKMEDFMKHLYKVPNTSKYVQKKYVRIGEGSITYSIGHHRFIEMARAAGAVYKINEGTGGTVLINLDMKQVVDPRQQGSIEYSIEEILYTIIMKNVCNITSMQKMTDEFMDDNY